MGGVRRGSERPRRLPVLDNLAIEKVQGYDITALYDYDAGEWGRVHVNDILSITSTWDQQELEGAPTTDCLGKWGLTCGSPTPEMRNNLRATWITPWGVAAQPHVAVRQRRRSPQRHGG